MNTIHITEPIWKEPRFVGIAHHRIFDDLKVYIDWIEESGKKTYPHPFYISLERAIKYPVQLKRVSKKKVVFLHIIPIPAMEEMRN